MNCARKCLRLSSRPQRWRAGIYALCVLFCALLFVACTHTVAPRLAVSSQASFDQGGQNSGIIGIAGNDGFFVTQHFIDRYNALIGLYGAKFGPPLTPNQGIFLTSTNTAIICNSAMEHFAAMNRWKRQGAPPWFTPK